MQTNQTSTPTSNAKQPGSAGVPTPKSAPIPLTGEMLKHVAGACAPTKGW